MERIEHYYADQTRGVMLLLDNRSSSREQRAEMAKLLVIGNFDGYRDLLLHALIGNEFDVILANNAHEAIEKSIQEAPDLIPLDGLDVLRSVKENPNNDQSLAR